MASKLSKDQTGGNRFISAIMALTGVTDNSNLRGASYYFGESVIDGNNLEVQVPFQAPNAKIVGPRIAVEMPKETGIEFSYSSWKHDPDGDNTKSTPPTFRFNLRSSDNPTYVLESKYGFHHTVDTVFGTKLRGMHKSCERTTVADVGLPVHEELDVDLEYTGIAGLWNTLPPELLQHITAFKFVGPSFAMEWPRNPVGFKDLQLDHIAVGRQGVAGFCAVDKNTEEFYKQLTATGKVVRTHTTKEGVGVARDPQDEFILRSKMDTATMSMLEALTRKRLDSDVVSSPETTLNIKKKVLRDSFFYAPEIRDMQVSGTVKAGDIAVSSDSQRYFDHRHSPNVPCVHFSNASFEDLEKLMRLGDNFSSLYMMVPDEHTSRLKPFPLLEPKEDKK